MIKGNKAEGVNRLKKLRSTRKLDQHHLPIKILPAASPDQDPQVGVYGEARRALLCLPPAFC
jgi:hypothetical protein